MTDGSDSGTTRASGEASLSGRVVLSKHHGRGNDFLVLLDPAGEFEVSARAAAALCDRHRGVGADGFIRARPFGEDPATSRPYEVVTRMELYNADGSMAEMSGNGLRCLGQALWNAGSISGDTALVATGAGIRKITLQATTGRHTSSISAEMGEVTLHGDVGLGELSWLGDRARSSVLRAGRASAGNPHLVILVENLDSVDIDRAGVAAQDAFAGGINLEAVALRTPDSVGGSGSEAMDVVDLAIFERGAGRTLACGTGSCAAAATLRGWGLVGDALSVVNPGGVLEVNLSGSAAFLGGPVDYVADVLVERTDLVSDCATVL